MAIRNPQLLRHVICNSTALIFFSAIQSHMTVCIFLLLFLLGSKACRAYSLYWLFSGVDHPVHSQVMSTFEGTGTELTDVVSLICRTNSTGD